MNQDRSDLETLLLHAGSRKPRPEGAIATPIYQSSTFEYSGESSYHDIRYIRLNNTPNHEVLAQKLAAIEETEDAVVAGSGMAAISTALMAILKTGDHLLIQNSLYGGTHDFVTRDLPDMGITVDFIDVSNPSSWDALRKPNTRAIYVETMTNPLLEVGDLEEVVRFATAHQLVSMIDNTFASPVNFKPCTLGYDLSLHSATKYLNGHSDLVAGAVCGSRDLVTKVRHKLNHLGGSLEPFGCFLLERGMKTLALRVERQNENALALATFLESQPGVRSVRYPGLASHANHERARRLFRGHGCMIALELDTDVAGCDRFLAHLRLPASAPSLGGVETLITRPALTSHSGMSAEERARSGIRDELIRISVGIESSSDQIADFEGALATLETAKTS